jgi:hypothetical protein
MKYFKFTQIDPTTGISINRQTPKEGPRDPDIKGLQVLFRDNIEPHLHFGTADDDATDDPDNQCWIITSEEFAVYVRRYIEHEIWHAKPKLYEEENALRRAHLVGKYDDTATVAGVYKYEQAKAVLTGRSISTTAVKDEATFRGVDPAVLAQRIVERHEEFRAKESKIAGIRGKQLDRLESFTVDDADPWASFQEFHKLEEVGTREEQVFENGERVTKQVPVTVRYYGIELGARYQNSGS